VQDGGSEPMDHGSIAANDTICRNVHMVMTLEMCY
jgi:hypothetical protein